jgi:hypothetical protein
MNDINDDGTFGYDSLDAIRSGCWPPYGWDVIDVLNEGRELDIPTRCPACNAEWLTGPESLAARRCWSCRTGGGAA